MTAEKFQGSLNIHLNAEASDFRMRIRPGILEFLSNNFILHSQSWVWYDVCKIVHFQVPLHLNSYTFKNKSSLNWAVNEIVSWNVSEVVLQDWKKHRPKVIYETRKWNYLCQKFKLIGNDEFNHWNNTLTEATLFLTLFLAISSLECSLSGKEIHSCIWWTGLWPGVEPFILFVVLMGMFILITQAYIVMWFPLPLSLSDDYTGGEYWLIWCCCVSLLSLLQCIDWFISDALFWSLSHAHCYIDGVMKN